MGAVVAGWAQLPASPSCWEAGPDPQPSSTSDSRTARIEQRRMVADSSAWEVLAGKEASATVAAVVATGYGAE